MKDFMNKPVTWGGYFKLCGACWLLSVVMSAVYVKLLKETYF